jgi:trehalose 6-phosphate synthase
MLIDLLSRHGGHWVFTAPPDRPEAGPAEADGVRLYPVQLPEKARRQHYDTISIGLFLRLFHYMYDTSAEPRFEDEVLDAWETYEEVNRIYAKQLAELTENTHDEWIVVNDPHLMMVPAFLATELPGRNSRLTYFLGTPWCEPDYFCLLPAWLRTRILRSLLACDVVGFHASRWANAFLACCARFLPDVEVSDQVVRHSHGITKVVTAPFPVDADVLHRMRHEPATNRWRQELARMSQGRRVLLRADRLDLWKNLPRGFEAYERLLRRRPELASRYWFCAVVSTPSRAAGRHRAYQDETAEVVRCINDRFGRPGMDAVSLVFPQRDSRHCVVAGLSMCQAAIVNSTYDGLNLFAKEAGLLLGDHATLLLSVNAGVHEQLGRYACPVDPFDIDQTSAAIEQAMEAGDAPGHACARRELLTAENPGSWLRSVFPSLAAPAGTHSLNGSELNGSERRDALT